MVIILLWLSSSWRGRRFISCNRVTGRRIAPLGFFLKIYCGLGRLKRYETKCNLVEQGSEKRRKSACRLPATAEPLAPIWCRLLSNVERFVQHTWKVKGDHWAAWNDANSWREACIIGQISLDSLPNQQIWICEYFAMRFRMAWTWVTLWGSQVSFRLSSWVQFEVEIRIDFLLFFFFLCFHQLPIYFARHAKLRYIWEGGFFSFPFDVFTLVIISHLFLLHSVKHFELWDFMLWKVPCK